MTVVRRPSPLAGLLILVAHFALGCEDKAALQIEEAKRVARSDLTKATVMLDTPELKSSPRAARLRRQWQVEAKDRAADAEALAAAVRARELYQQGKVEELLELSRTIGGKARRIRALFRREAGLTVAAAEVHRKVRGLLEAHQVLRAIACLDRLERACVAREEALPEDLAAVRARVRQTLIDERRDWQERYEAASAAGDAAAVRVAWMRLIKLHDTHDPIPIEAAARLKVLEAKAKSPAPGSLTTQDPERQSAPLRPEAE